MTDLTAVNASAVTEAATLAQTDYFLTAIGGVTRKVTPPVAAAAIGIDVYSAEVSAAQAALAALAAGAPLYTTMPTISASIPSPFMLQTTAGVKVFTHNGTTATFAGWLGEVLFDDAATLLAYAGAERLTVGTIVRTREEGFAYSVVSSGQHVVTSGGDKMQILPDNGGVIRFEATGAVSGASDHSADLTEAIAALATAGTNKLNFGPGTWRFSYETLPEGIEITGVPWLTIFKPVASTDRAILTMDSGSASVFLDGPTFRDVTFQGAEATPTFDEQKHLVTLHGVDGVLFENCRFVGWRGDALYFGSSDSGGTTERHNRNVRIIGCYFDGVNNENRQAISCIDIDGIWIDRNSFINCTKSTMPGSIDFEPNANSFHVIRNVWVTNNTFKNCGGNFGVISVYIPSVVPLPTNINILNNRGEDLTLSSGSGFVGIATNRVPSTTDVDMAVKITGNDVRNCAGRPFGIFGAKGVRMARNVWADCTLSAYFGFNTANNDCRDISIADTFIRCGSTIDEGVRVFTVTNIDFTGSNFDDVGNAAAGSCAIRFATGTSSGVKLNQIGIVSPTGKTVRAIQKDVGHTFTPSTNQHLWCNWGTLVNAFEAEESDTIFTAYTPIVEGASTAGTGTYTRQFGRWRRIGRQVFVEIEIVQSGHTGSGLIEISLPFAAAGSANNELKAIAISLDGATTTGGQIGLINPAAVANSINGAIRCYHSATGTLTQTTVPSGAATYRAAGTYMGA